MAMMVIVVLAVLWNWGPGFVFGYYVVRAQSLMSPAEAYACVLISGLSPATCNKRVAKAIYARNVFLWAEADPRACSRHLCDTWVQVVGQIVLQNQPELSVEEAEGMARRTYSALEHTSGPFSQG